MGTSSRWSQIFADAQLGEAECLIDGTNYFNSVMRAISSTNNSSHFIFISGWMIDIELEISRASSKTKLIDHLLLASSRGVNVYILVWNNPLYQKKIEYAQSKISQLGANVQFIIDKSTVVIKDVDIIIEDIVNLIEKLYTWSNDYSADAPDLNDGILDEIVDKATAYKSWRSVARGALNSKISSGDPSPISLARWAKASRFSIVAHHEKNIVVFGEDGVTGFCGGIDLNKNRLYDNHGTNLSSANYYHDVALRITAGPAEKLLDRFVERLRAAGTNAQFENAKKLAEVARRFKPTRRWDKLEEPPQPKNVKIVHTYNSPDGLIKDRSCEDAYIKIIRNAKKNIYIEDQYLIDKSIAREINSKLRRSELNCVILVAQDELLTTDILIPRRKRIEFRSLIQSGLSELQKRSLFLCTVVNTRKFRTRFAYHSGMHSKILIADDEILMIGSCNLNRRSLTADSETSAVVFDSEFVRKFRRDLFRHSLLNPQPEMTGGNDALDEFKVFADMVRSNSKSSSALGAASVTYLVEDFIYPAGTAVVTDLDDKIVHWLSDHPRTWEVLSAFEMTHVILDKLAKKSGQDWKPSLQDILANPKVYAPKLADIIWDNFVDPSL